MESRNCVFVSELKPGGHVAAVCSSVLMCNLFATQLVELWPRKCDDMERLQQQPATHLQPKAWVGADFRGSLTFKMGLEMFLRVKRV